MIKKNSVIKKKNPVWRFFHHPPSGVNVYIGNVGSGKTTAAARFTVRALQCGIHVYTNIPELSALDGVTYIPTPYIGKYDISHGLLVLDEAGIDYNNRASLQRSRKGSDPAMDSAAIRWWKLIRHYHCSAVVFSQAQDFDVTIRRLASRLYILQRSIFPLGFFFSCYKRLAPKWVTDQSTGDPRLEWSFVPLSTRHIFRPRWYKFFNSWSAPELPPLPSDPA